MSLYARVFLQILDSSLAEDCRVRHVFEDLLKLANQDGVVDMTHEAIARRTNENLEIVRHAIIQLEKPDPKSRDPGDDGRRIVRLDGHRDWGWRIVNWLRYDKIRTNTEHREAKARSMRNYRANKTALPLASPSEKKEPQKQPHPHPHPHPQGTSARDPHVDYTSSTGSLHGTPQSSEALPAGVCGVKKGILSGNEDPNPITAEAIYDAYPKKKSKPQALKAIRVAMKKIPAVALLANVQRYATERAGQDPQYTPYPATWFNGERWKDEPSDAPKPPDVNGSEPHSVTISKNF